MRSSKLVTTLEHRILQANDIDKHLINQPNTKPQTWLKTLMMLIIFLFYFEIGKYVHTPRLVN